MATYSVTWGHFYINILNHGAAAASCWWTHPEHQSPFCTAIQIWVGAMNNVSCNDLVTNNQRSNYPSLSVKDHLPPPTPIIISPSSQTGYHHIVSHNFGNIHQHHQTHIDNTHKYYIYRVNFKVPNCMGNRQWEDLVRLLKCSVLIWTYLSFNEAK